MFDCEPNWFASSQAFPVIFDSHRHNRSLCIHNKGILYLVLSAHALAHQANGGPAFALNTCFNFMMIQFIRHHTPLATPLKGVAAAGMQATKRQGLRWLGLPSTPRASSIFTPNGSITLDPPTPQAFLCHWHASCQRKTSAGVHLWGPRCWTRACGKHQTRAASWSTCLCTYLTGKQEQRLGRLWESVSAGQQMRQHARCMSRTRLQVALGRAVFAPRGMSAGVGLKRPGALQLLELSKG